jgi:hypothetical protein
MSIFFDANSFPVFTQPRPDADGRKMAIYRPF